MLLRKNCTSPAEGFHNCTCPQPKGFVTRYSNLLIFPTKNIMIYIRSRTKQAWKTPKICQKGFWWHHESKKEENITKRFGFHEDGLLQVNLVVESGVDIILDSGLFEGNVDVEQEGRLTSVLGPLQLLLHIHDDKVVVLELPLLYQVSLGVGQVNYTNNSVTIDCNIRSQKQTGNKHHPTNLFINELSKLFQLFKDKFAAQWALKERFFVCFATFFSRFESWGKKMP